MPSRFNSDRYMITGTLTNTSALHVGSLDDLAVDRPIARDGAGRAIIPGTSLAGALREAWRQAQPTDPPPAVEVALWGGRPDDADSSDGAAVSRIVIEDARLVNSSGAPAPMMVRTRTAINDALGTADGGKLFSTEVMPPGQTFEFQATVELLDGGMANEGHINELVAILRRSFAIGAGTTTGLGEVLLTDLKAHRRRRGDLDGLRALLAGAPGAPWEPGDPADSPAQPGRTLTIDWHPIGPVIFGDSPPGEVFDMVPLTAPGPHDCVHLTIPGTSIKGALRAQAERILNTVSLRVEAPQQHAAITLLFGSPPLRDTRAAQHRGRRGALRIADVTSTLGWTRETWDALISSPKMTSEQRQTPEPARSPAAARLALLRRCKCTATTTLPAGVAARSRDFTIGDHVAIDRWTGGAKDGALFTVLEPWLTDPWDWQPLKIHLSSALRHTLDAPVGHREIGADTHSPADDRHRDQAGEGARVAATLLWLTLRDLADGWVPLGHATTRGYGAMRADGPGFGLPAATRTAWHNFVERSSRA